MKKRALFSIILSAALLMSMLSGCGSKKETEAADAQTSYIGIISAMQNEIDLLLGEADIERTDTIGGVDYYVGKLCGRDVVIATSLVQHDYGQITNEGFEWTAGSEGAPGEEREAGQDGYYPCDERLVDLAYNSAVKVVGEDHAFKGVIATGDQFVASEDYVDLLQDNHDAIACEMEGASVAVVCRQYDVPFVVIRAMSDKADGNAHESFDNMGDIAADNSSRIIMQMLKDD